MTTLAISVSSCGSETSCSLSTQVASWSIYVHRLHLQ